MDDSQLSRRSWRDLLCANQHRRPEQLLLHWLLRNVRRPPESTMVDGKADWHQGRNARNARHASTTERASTQPTHAIPSWAAALHGLYALHRICNQAHSVSADTALPYCVTAVNTDIDQYIIYCDKAGSSVHVGGTSARTDLPAAVAATMTFGPNGTPLGMSAMGTSPTSKSPPPPLNTQYCN